MAVVAENSISYIYSYKNHKQTGEWVGSQLPLSRAKANESLTENELQNGKNIDTIFKLKQK